MKNGTLQLSIAFCLLISKAGLTKEAPQATPLYTLMTQAQYEKAKKDIKAERRSSIERCKKLSTTERAACINEANEKEKSSQKELDSLKPSTWSKPEQ